MKFYDRQFMEQLKHQQKLLKLLQEEHKEASEQVRKSIKNEIQIRTVYENQIEVVNQFEQELMGVEELECSL